MKKLLTIVAVAALTLTACGSTSVPKTTDGEEIVASTSVGEVTADDLYQELKKQVGFDVLMTMVDTQLIDEVLETTDEMQEQAQTSVDEIKASYGDDEAFQTALETYGYGDEETLLNAFLDQIKRSKYIELKVSESITDEEIQAAFDAIVPEIQASHILITPEENTEEALVAAREIAVGLIADLNEGADFAELATEYSADTGSAANGGDLGFFGTGAMVAEFEEAAFALEVGEFTAEPVETQYGYHIILKTDAEEIGSLEDQKETILAELVANKVSADSTLATSILDDLREEYDFSITDSELLQTYEAYISANE